MTNLIEPIIQKLEYRLGLAGIKFIARFPEDIPRLGNRFPLAIIKEESKEFEPTSGGLYSYFLNIIIVLVSDVLKDRMKYMNDLEVLVFNQLFDSSRLNGLVMNINPVIVNMGNLISGSDIAAYAGFTETNSFREITIRMQMQDSRY